MSTMKGETMYLLKDLWDGNVNPSERYIRKGSEYSKLTKEISDCMDQMIEEMSPKCAELLEEFQEKRLILNAILEEDAFIRGVRIGAQFILDVVGDYKSQLPQMGDK